ncbi:transporter substrate-binding domain-containing protein [Pelomonas sp. SE-A7]|uniref:substrate-binding periplasmic protein n=1 Tax=Pelomonas sp. SE-A7 TaxID=3054953 RepID=UPI00259CD6F0|nr:transporter substrate-binding domain-containing protein [Pelomonas sp. SE-A7]MDM4768387.1 transporter substrate-binding domain-containing protein [Pelomonas sp. SE-A7]
MRSTLLISLLLATLGAGALAEPCGRFRMAYYEYSGLYYRGEDGAYKGIDKELVEEIARRTGCQFDTVTESRIRIWALMEQGLLDMTASAIPTPDREKAFEMLPYLRSHQYALLHPRVAPVPATAAEFIADRRLHLLVVRGYRFVPSLEAWVAALRSQRRVVEAPDQPAAIRAFRAGRADAMLIGGNTLAHARLREPDLNRYPALSYAPDEPSIATLALSRERIPAADRDRIRAAVVEMQRDGSLAAIVQRHLGIHPH